MDSIVPWTGRRAPLGPQWTLWGRPSLTTSSFKGSSDTPPIDLIVSSGVMPASQPWAKEVSHPFRPEEILASRFTVCRPEYKGLEDWSL